MKNINANLDASVIAYFNAGNLFTPAEVDTAFNELCEALVKATKCTFARAREFLKRVASCTTFADLLAVFEAELIAQRREEVISAVAELAGCESKYAARAYDENSLKDIEFLITAARGFSDNALDDDFNYGGGGSSGLGGGP